MVDQGLSLAEVGPVSAQDYQGETDFKRLWDFLVEARAIAGQAGYWHVGDLAWRLFLQTRDGDPRQNLRLWSDREGRLLGFAGYYPHSAFDLEVHPHFLESDLMASMLDWIEARWRSASAGAQKKPLASDSGVYENERALMNLLERRGYQREETYENLMSCPLGEPPPAPELPEGFAVRPLAGEEEAAERAAVHAEAFGSRRMTAEHYKRLMSWPGYTRDLDLVAVAPDGHFAAYCIAWYDAANRVAEFEPVGTRPSFRGLGLGRAVLLDGLHRLKALGAGQVIVGPVDPNLETFYVSAGFRPLARNYGYTKSENNT